MKECREWPKRKIKLRLLIYAAAAHPEKLDAAISNAFSG